MERPVGRNGSEWTPPPPPGVRSTIRMDPKTKPQETHGTQEGSWSQEGLGAPALGAGSVLAGQDQDTCQGGAIQGLLQCREAQTSSQWHLTRYLGTPCPRHCASLQKC